MLGIATAVAVLGASHIPTCPMAAVFGVPCPGCGLTRATMAALHGDFHRAFAFHPLFILVTPIYALLMSWIALDYVRGRTVGPLQTLGPAATSTLFTALGAGLVVLMLAVWIARFLGYFGGPVPVTSVWSCR